MGHVRQTHTDVALFALWLKDNASELQSSPRTAEAVQRLYNSTKQNGAGYIGLHAIKKLTKALEIPLAKVQRARVTGTKLSDRTNRVIVELGDLSKKLEALAKHVLTLTDDVQTMEGMNISEFEITDGLKSLLQRKSDPSRQETVIVPKWTTEDGKLKS